MDMNITNILLIAGFVMLIIDLAFIGVNFIMFAGIGAIITGMISYLNIIPDGDYQMYYYVVLYAVVTGLTIAGLWKPMQKMQNQVPKDESSDMIGVTVKTTQETTLLSGQVSYSGTTWLAILDDNFSSEAIPENTNVTVTKVSGNTLFVKR